MSGCGYFTLVVFLALTSRAVADDPKAIVPEENVEYADIVASTLSMALPEADQNGIGSRFGDPGDKWIGGRMACAPHDFVDSKAFVCAHRSYPCGTILVVEYQGKRSWCVVADRGPYGANVFAADGKIVTSTSGAAWYVKIKQDQMPPSDLCPDGNCTGKWRGVIDMGPAVSKAMGHPGMGYVKVWTLRRIVSWQKYMAKKKTKPLS